MNKKLDHNTGIVIFGICFALLIMVLGLSAATGWQINNTDGVTINGMSLSSVGTPMQVFYGDGTDGAVTITSPTTLTRNMYYSSLAISGSGSIVTAGYRIYISGTLDLTAAPANAITDSGLAGSPAVADALGANGNQGASPDNAYTTGTYAAVANSGKAGVTGTGTNSTNITGSYGMGGTGGPGGTGGSGTAGAGGNAGTNSMTMAQAFFGVPTQWPMYGESITNKGGNGGQGGASGAGDSVNKGGGGGGGGGPAGPIWIMANTISRGGSTTAGCISTCGGTGGAGGNAATGNCGGGGGGGGGAGGLVIIGYNSLTGTTATGAISALGGVGGAGGTGIGSGTAGGGGTGGYGGKVALFNLQAGTTSTTTGTAGGAPSGQTGGTAGACTVNL